MTACDAILQSGVNMTTALTHTLNAEADKRRALCVGVDVFVYVCVFVCFCVSVFVHVCICVP